MIENENSDVGVLLYIYTKCTSERTGNIRLRDTESNLIIPATEKKEDISREKYCQ